MNSSGRPADWLVITQVALIDGVFNKASKAGWPVAPFFTAYVEHMMLPTIDDIASARVDTREKTGLSTVTLIAQTSVPPKAYFGRADLPPKNRGAAAGAT